MYFTMKKTFVNFIVKVLCVNKFFWYQVNKDTHVFIPIKGCVQIPVFDANSHEFLLSVDMILLRGILVVIKSAVLLASSPEYTIELPPRVSLNLFRSDFWGQ